MLELPPDWVDLLGNLLDDGANLGHLVDYGRQFGLEGKALDEFASRSLDWIVAADGVPITTHGRYGAPWEIDLSGGPTAEAAARDALDEWKARGRPRGNLDDIWFGRRRDLGA